MRADNQNAFGLAQQVCVVTGGASGIGRGIALAFAREGARIAVLDRNEAGAAETVRLVVEAGAEAISLACDTSDPDSAERARIAVAQKFGDADVLVNNAGIIGRGGLADISLQDWNGLLSVNLTGYFICAQAFGRPMLTRGSGAIVHVASITAIETLPRVGGYGIGKAGVAMLSQVLAAEWGLSGVRSNVVHPGLVQTPMTQATYDAPAVAMARAKSVPLGRVAQPDDIAQAVLFLASSRAAYVNGSALLVDGGLSSNLMSFIPRVDEGARL